MKAVLSFANGIEEDISSMREFGYMEDFKRLLAAS